MTDTRELVTTLRRHRRSHRRAAEADLRAEVERLNALADLRAQHAAWSQAQFGDVSAVGPAKHLAKEAMEVAADPLDPIEHADCWMLLWDMQRRAGISDAQLADAIREKLAINQARKWPAPKEGEAREHDRAALTPPPAAQEPVEPTALRYVPTITSDRTNPETLGRGGIAARPQRWLQSMLADAERDMQQRAAEINEKVKKP